MTFSSRLPKYSIEKHLLSKYGRSLCYAAVLTTSLLAVLAGCGGATSAATGPVTPPAPVPDSVWVASWADAPSTSAGGSGSERTFREIVKPSVGGRGVMRLSFSNYFGASEVTLGAVHVGIQTTGASVSDDTPVTFNGAPSITIPPGGSTLSDNVALGYSYGQLLSVTEYVRGSWANLTSHAQGVNVVTNYQTVDVAGDKTQDLAGVSFTQTTLNTYLLNRVDVYGNYKETIPAFGSSTTDGYQSGLDKHKTYPEQLADALHAAGHDDIAVANVGIYGTTVLGISPIAGLNRFTRDVVSLPGVSTVIDYLGANDLRNDCVPADALILGKQSVIVMAHAAGLKIYEGVTAPSTFCGTQSPNGFGTRFAQGSGEDAQRFLLNTWQTSTVPSVVNGTTVQPPQSDGVIDFNSVLADKTNLSYMIPMLDSGDDIHPNAIGYGEMVRAIPLSQF
ncbi:putative secreted protein [Acidisarcina polymorpha]|uniref:Putative secreted protein n=1 Tax=Acidisarcina polymorpha TaxID=2211140 RepID=A0A2Z5FT06_9BACT|nr:GDSL-type esterase/lipase family protein [Acidisarcina polymorpha]AXC09969.1 putative secreted protein [Acidisarcina polymorpha]